MPNCKHSIFSWFPKSSSCFSNLKIDIITTTIYISIVHLFEKPPTKFVATFIVSPSIVFLTANSTNLTFFVLGISIIDIIFDGTCLGDAFFLIDFLISSFISFVSS